MPVFEPNSLLPHCYACQRATGIRVRGLYCTKDTFVTTVLYRMRETSQVDIPWLERQTGVQHQTLKKHDGRWCRTTVDASSGSSRPSIRSSLQGRIVPPQKASGGTIHASTRKIGRQKVRKGGLEPPRVISPHGPEPCASAIPPLSREPSEDAQPSRRGRNAQGRAACVVAGREAERQSVLAHSGGDTVATPIRVVGLPSGRCAEEV